MSSTGMKIPVGVNAQGRADLSTGSDLIRQLVLTALRDCESRNPFQDLGISEEIIFDVNDPITEAKITIRIQEIFARFEAQDLARLDQSASANPLTFSQSKEGEMDVEIKYIDLESDRPKEISLKLPTDLGGAD